MSQLAFDLRRSPAFGSGDFLPAACNRDALGWIQRWPDWPSFALAISGPAGCGKTHLAHMFAAHSDSLILAADRLDEATLAQWSPLRGVVIEDADRGVDEISLFHLYNRLGEAKAPLLLTGRSPPARWPIGLADLRSRLASLPLVAIGSPDDSLLAGVLVKLFADRQLRIEPEVARFLVPRIDRSFAALRDMVDRLDRAALAAGRPITVPLVRSLLERVVPDPLAG